MGEKVMEEKRFLTPFPLDAKGPEARDRKANSQIQESCVDSV
jgi:hypothetical protein